MHPNGELIARFYQAFQCRDHQKMAACYHADATFSDAIFPRLTRWQAVAMWHMLCERGKDLVLDFSAVTADDRAGGAHWDAHYTYSASGRMVHNRIDARFSFQDGLILRHEDRFSLRRWATMAIGPSMAVLAILPPVRAAIRRKAADALNAFIQKNGLARE